ncbi:MAG: C40 family peptidase, partial [Promethearchaeota archaeon]
QDFIQRLRQIKQTLPAANIPQMPKMNVPARQAPTMPNISSYVPLLESLTGNKISSGQITDLQSKLSQLQPMMNNISNTGSSVVAKAKSYQGTPYQWGGNTPGKGLDCSGLTQNVFKQFGINLPRTSKEQSKVGTPVSLAQAIPGDLLFFGTGKKGIHHVGVYAGNGMYVHAPKKGDVVKTSSLADRNDLAAIKRVLS